MQSGVDSDVGPFRTELGAESKESEVSGRGEGGERKESEVSGRGEGGRGRRVRLVGGGRGGEQGE